MSAAGAGMEAEMEARPGMARIGTDWHGLASLGMEWHRMAQIDRDGMKWYTMPGSTGMGTDWHRLA